MSYFLGDLFFELLVGFVDLVEVGGFLLKDFEVHGVDVGDLFSEMDLFLFDKEFESSGYLLLGTGEVVHDVGKGEGKIEGNATVHDFDLLVERGFGVSHWVLVYILSDN